MTTPRQVAAALKREAAKLDAEWRGTHVFDAPYSVPGLPNWTASFHCRGSRCPLDDMRAALERVQARYPEVDW